MMMPSKLDLLYIVFAGIMLYSEHTFQTVLLPQDTADFNMYILGDLVQF